MLIMALLGHIRHGNLPPACLFRLRRVWTRLRGDALDRRGRRVVLGLVLLWILNVFDLVCTITVRSLDTFEEANPLANMMLQHPAAMIVFKLSMVAFATTVLVLFRRQRLVEIACWGVCAVYAMLSLLWLRHLEVADALTRCVFTGR